MVTEGVGVVVRVGVVVGVIVVVLVGVGVGVFVGVAVITTGVPPDVLHWVIQHPSASIIFKQNSGSVSYGDGKLKTYGGYANVTTKVHAVNVVSHTYRLYGELPVKDDMVTCTGIFRLTHNLWLHIHHFQ